MEITRDLKSRWMNAHLQYILLRTVLRSFGYRDHLLKILFLEVQLFTYFFKKTEA